MKAAAPREDNDVRAHVAAEAVEGAAADDGEADEDEADEQSGMARGDQAANGERRPRRRGRRGGRRRRGTGAEEGLAGSIADELGPASAPEATSAVADFDGGSSYDLRRRSISPAPPEPSNRDQPAVDAQPEPVPSAPAPEETVQEAERAAARGVRPCARKSAS